MSDNDIVIVEYPEFGEKWIGIDSIFPMPEIPWEVQDQCIYAINYVPDWLEKGLDPNYMQENETLYENVLWKLREGEPGDYEYQRQLVQLLLAYGGKSPTYGYTWHFKDPAFDVCELKKLDHYQTFFRKVDNKYCKEGYIIDTATGEEIAWL